MQAFHNDIKIKEKYLARVIAHQRADNLIRGEGWDGKKGGAVGCTLENYDHALYPIELGIPVWLARVEDELFEKMSVEKSKTWPENFLNSINIGADLEQVKAPFISMLLKHCLKSLDEVVFDESKFPVAAEAVTLSKNSVLQMIDTYQMLNENKIISATATATATATASAAWAAAASAAESATKSAAWAAEYAAASAAWAAKSAGWAEGWAARWAAESAAESAWAKSAANDYYADQLLILLAHAK